MSSADLPPWERIVNFLQNSPSAKKGFTTLQRNGCKLQAIIIALWEDPDEPTPSRYLTDRAVLSGWPRIYFGKDDAFPRFNDPNKSESPKIYMNLTRLIDMVVRLRAECEGHNKTSRKPPLHVGCVLWKHPEAHYLPIDEFLKMQKQFPGCIRQ